MHTGCVPVDVAWREATARLSVEGWDLPDQTVDLTGDGMVDGRRLASEFAHILGVALPHQP